MQIKIILNILLLYLIKSILQQWASVGAQMVPRKERGEACQTKMQMGTCTTWNDCPQMESLLKFGHYKIHEVERCGFEGISADGEIICCPTDKSRSEKPQDTTSRSDDMMTKVETDLLATHNAQTTKPTTSSLESATTETSALSLNGNEAISVGKNQSINHNVGKEIDERTVKQEILNFYLNKTILKTTSDRNNMIPELNYIPNSSGSQSVNVSFVTTEESKFPVQLQSPDVDSVSGIQLNKPIQQNIQQNINNAQIWNTNSMGQSTNQRPSIPDIQNFQFQLTSTSPSESQQSNNPLSITHTLQSNIGQTNGQSNGGPTQGIQNVQQLYSQQNLEQYTRWLLQQQERNQQQPHYTYNLNMLNSQKMLNIPYYNMYYVLPQQSSPPLSQVLTPQTQINNFQLNQMSFNPQLSQNYQNVNPELLIVIPNAALNQMSFQPQRTAQQMTVTLTANSGILNLPAAQYMESLIPLNRQNRQPFLGEYNQFIGAKNLPNHSHANGHLLIPQTEKEIPNILHSNLNTQQISELKMPPQPMLETSEKPINSIVLPFDPNTVNDRSTESQLLERTTPSTIQTNPQNDIRPAIKACNILEDGLFATLTPLIVDGKPSDWGEFPYMAAIAYKCSETSEDYCIYCGGTLISSRFVLTAAHCVAMRKRQPEFVRLGIVNFTDPEQLKYQVQLSIRQLIIHDNYSLRSSYHDIALMELERRVQFSQYIYPTCLYTNIDDPPNTNVNNPSNKNVFYVMGWGSTDIISKNRSEVLLKASLQITPLEECEKIYKQNGLPQQLQQGVTHNLMCAKDNNGTKDSCEGDSGGPLILQIDETTRNYRIVGIVLSGFECATFIPGLYLRVAEYLDFIERHVWLNNQYDDDFVRIFKRSNR